jgi:hypothetical protein
MPWSGRSLPLARAALQESLVVSRLDHFWSQGIEDYNLNLL